MSPDEIRRHISKLDAPDWDANEAVWPIMKPLGVQVVPFLLESYSDFRHWQGRVCLVHHAARFSRISEESFRLGLAATSDRSKRVRFSACLLLAYSLRRSALEYLRPLLDFSDTETVENARAAITAIEMQNHHLFKDRFGRGTLLVLNPEDRERHGSGALSLAPTKPQ